jgi:hypothetical protein
MMRGTFANIRIRNHMLGARNGREGGYHPLSVEGRDVDLRRRDEVQEEKGVPLVIFAGVEYGNGSSRDWAAKGTNLLGVRAVIAQSFERIHRSNLVGMGVATTLQRDLDPGTSLPAPDPSSRPGACHAGRHLGESHRSSTNSSSRASRICARRIAGAGARALLMRPRSSFAGAAIEVSDLARSVAFHRPVAADARLPSRLDQPGPGDVVARLRSFRDAPGQGRHLLRAGCAVARGFGREPRPRSTRCSPSCATPVRRSSSRRRKLDYLDPGYYSVGFRDPDGVPIEVMHRLGRSPRGPRCRAGASCPAMASASAAISLSRSPASQPYPALDPAARIAGHAHNMVGLARAAAANGYAALALSLRGWLGSEGENDQGLRQPLDILAAIDWLAKRPLVDPRPHRAGRRASMGGTGGACWPPAHKPPIRAVASFFAPTDLARWREANPYMRDYLDDLCGPEGLPVRSPILRVAQIDAPVLLLHGDRDRERAGRAVPRHGRVVAQSWQGRRGCRDPRRHPLFHRAAECRRAAHAVRLPASSSHPELASMRVSEAVNSRRSMRVFKPDLVAKADIEWIVENATARPRTATCSPGSST